MIHMRWHNVRTFEAIRRLTECGTEVVFELFKDSISCRDNPRRLRVLGNKC